jgi:hypothetical protein
MSVKKGGVNLDGDDDDDYDDDYDDDDGGDLTSKTNLTRLFAYYDLSFAFDCFVCGRGFVALSHFRLD